MSLSAFLTTKYQPVLKVECGIVAPGKGIGPAPVLTVDNFNIYPTLDQLRQIRDAITACLESPEARALYECEADSLRIDGEE